MPGVLSIACACSCAFLATSGFCCRYATRACACTGGMFAGILYGICSVVWGGAAGNVSAAAAWRRRRGWSRMRGWGHNTLHWSQGCRRSLRECGGGSRLDGSNPTSMHAWRLFSAGR
eukprot:364937-Chlamydomonas_euryale.AAC.8